MGKYEELKDFPGNQFRRLTGIQREPFEKRVEILVKTQNKRYRRVYRTGFITEKVVIHNIF